MICIQCTNKETIKSMQGYPFYVNGSPHNNNWTIESEAGEVITEDLEVAETFNEFFIEEVELLKLFTRNADIYLDPGQFYIYILCCTYYN